MYLLEDPCFDDGFLGVGILRVRSSLTAVAVRDGCADMIHEKEPLVNTYVSVPKDFGHLNCASFVAGKFPPKGGAECVWAVYGWT